MSASQQQVRNSSFIALRGQDVTPLPSVTGTGRVLPEAAPSVLTEADHAMPHEDADTLRIARQYPAGGAFTVPGLFIAESREIPAEIGGAGLYTSRRLEVGTLLGFYKGDIFSDEAYAIYIMWVPRLGTCRTLPEVWPRDTANGSPAEPPPPGGPGPASNSDAPGGD